jgi:hypothetical protein
VSLSSAAAPGWVDLDPQTFARANHISTAERCRVGSWLTVLTAGERPRCGSTLCGRVTYGACRLRNGVILARRSPTRSTDTGRHLTAGRSVVPD